MDRHPTARRLITEGMRLFAERGIEGVKIIEIEEAAGLSPRSGAYYRHFATKTDLYAAAVADAATAMTNAVPGLPLAPAENIDAALEAIANLVLHSLDHRRDLILVTMRDRHLLANHVNATVWPPAGHRQFSSWLLAQNEYGILDIPDPNATAEIASGR